MVLPAILGAASAVPAIAGWVGNLFNDDRSEAQRLAREAAEGRGAGSLAARAAIQDQTRQMIGASRAGSTNPLLAERNAMLAGAELAARTQPAIAQQRAAEIEQGRRELAGGGTQQGALLQQGLGAIAGGLSSAAGFLGTQGAPQQPVAPDPAAAAAAPAIAPTPTLQFGQPARATPNLGNVAASLTGPGGAPAAPSAAVLGAPAQPAPAASPFGGMAGMLQLPPELQGLDPRLLIRNASGGF